MDPKKVKVIINWQEPKNVKDIKAFIRFANFYQWFINNFSALVLLLIDLRYEWSITFLSQFSNFAKPAFD